MSPEEIIEAFEAWYREEYVVRSGARGRASRHLEKHNGEYISDHARESFRIYCVGLQRAFLYKNTGV